MLLIKITIFFSITFLTYLFFVRLYYYDPSNNFRLNYKMKLFKEKSILDTELYIPMSVGFFCFVDAILILCSVFYLIFLR